MRGVSALQVVLDELQDAPVDVFAVWESVLPTDLAPPSTAVLGRFHARNTRQYWDPDKLLSDQLIAAAKANPERLKAGHGIPDVVWDAVLFYGPDVEWKDDVPFPEHYAAPVLDVVDEVRAELRTRTGTLKVR